jgi:hypothetical protein
MRPSLSLPIFLGSLVSLSEANPTPKPSVTFASFSQLNSGSVHNIVVEYSGEVNGELKIVYSSCDGVAIVSDAHHHVGSTHVGSHPLAARHVEHEDNRPTKFVWLTPKKMNKGCLRAFLNDDLIGQSEELVVTKRLARRSEKKAFKDVAGTDSMWFNGVAYLQQKQPDEVFVAAAKNKSFGILGGGISGLLSSVRLRKFPIDNNSGRRLILRVLAIAGFCGNPHLENHRVYGAHRWSI